MKIWFIGVLLTASLMSTTARSDAGPWVFVGELSDDGTLANATVDVTIAVATAAIDGTILSEDTLSAVVVLDGLLVVDVPPLTDEQLNEASLFVRVTVDDGADAVAFAAPLFAALRATRSLEAERAQAAAHADTLDGASTAGFLRSGEPTAGAAPLHWSNVTALPAGLADGVDDGVTFTPGSAIELVGGTLSLGGGIVSEQIATSAITSAKIAPATFGASEVGAITGPALAPNTLDRFHFALNSLSVTSDLGGGVTIFHAAAGCSLGEEMYASTASCQTVQCSSGPVRFRECAGGTTCTRTSPANCTGLVAAGRLFFPP